jgi:hypothetical protein
MSIINSILSEESLLEELNQKQKMAVHGWHRGDYSFSDHVFGAEDSGGNSSSDRVVIPLLSKDGATARPDSKVVEHLAAHGYDVHDYKAGHAIKSDGSDRRPFRIGAVLNQTDATPEVKKAFEADPARRMAKNKNDDLQVVISRHRHDVAGMSTNQNWKSCQQLSPNGKAEGLASALKSDISEGSHVAYLCRKGDNTASNALYRIALRPYKSANGHKIVRPSDRAYPSQNDDFSHTVRHFTEEHFPARDFKYKLSGGYTGDESEANRTIYASNFSDAEYKKIAKVSPFDVAHHPHISSNVIGHMIDHHPSYHLQLSRHPNASSANLQKLWNSSTDESAKVNVLSHPNVPRKIVDSVIADK